MPRSIVVSCRCTPEEIREFERRAALAGLSPAALMHQFVIGSRFPWGDPLTLAEFRVAKLECHRIGDLMFFALAVCEGEDDAEIKSLLRELIEKAAACCEPMERRIREVENDPENRFE